MVITEISDLRMYSGKARIVDTLTASLPVAYRERLRILADSIAAGRRDEGAMQSCLTTAFENEVGELITPLAVRPRICSWMQPVR